VLAVAGEEVEDWQGFATRYAAATGEVTLRIARETEGADAPVESEITIPALGSVARRWCPRRCGRRGLARFVGRRQPRGDLIASSTAADRGFASFSNSYGQWRPCARDRVRAGARHEIRSSPRCSSGHGPGLEERWLIGIPRRPQPWGAVGERETNPLNDEPRAVGMTDELTKSILAGLKRNASGDVSRKQLAGPIGIAEIAHNAFERGWHAYLTTLVLISINLAILNLLPIPVLDGGQALMIAIEGVKRSPISLRTREIVQQIGFTVLLMLMGLAFWNDLSRHWSRFVDWVRQSSGL
jgi:hypothetical protein